MAFRLQHVVVVARKATTIQCLSAEVEHGTMKAVIS